MLTPRFAKPSSAGYSPATSIDLLVGDLVIAVAEVGSKRIKVRSAVSLAPAVGVIRLRIDANEIRSNVFLPDGIDSSSDYHRISVLHTASSVAASV
jgi:hypothetical protein